MTKGDLVVLEYTIEKVELAILEQIHIKHDTNKLIELYELKNEMVKVYKHYERLV